MTYGGTPPTINVAGYAGFVNGDTSSSLTTKPTCSTTATSSSPVSGSPYASSCSGAADSNYSFKYVDGSVTVSPAPLGVTASDGSFTYGGTPPTITASYSGFVNGDTLVQPHHQAHVLDHGHELEPGRGLPLRRPPARARPTRTTRSATRAASVTVNPASLFVTASDGSFTYGGTPPTITAKYAGFVNGDIGLQPHHQAHVLDHGHELEPGRRLPVRLLLLGGG